ncbi:ABC transporter permease [Nocardiopsis gilva YIM 90087]|uniref:ABC transporter permease n=1 Tax=Nocardiopsis gilva YIM 90087 TaxID=1235441 RepID=A0A223SAH4_9ACTN|nr:ABC transporter permease [Nocardiopsis gilva]ASU85140.1 ABC transporter permease [Nocardiopsis gilva YIM 90087]
MSNSDTSALRPSAAPPPPDPRVEEGERRSPLLYVQRLLHAQATLGPAAVLVVAVIAFSLVSPNFLQPGNISLVLQQTAVIGTLAVGQTLIILTAGIDLSVGAVMVLCSMVMARLSIDLGLPGPAALLAGFLCGAACGLLNGTLVTRLNLPPFIVTLGAMNIYFALNLWISSSETVRGTDLPQLLLWTGEVFRVGQTSVTYGSVLMLLLVAVLAYVLKATTWGRHVYATGDDREAARLSGIRTKRVLLSVYVTAGLIYAVGAWVLIGRVGAASPQAGEMDNLDSITAVVLGGTSLFGGRGLVVGTLIGALIVGICRNGLSLAGVEVLWQNFAVGVLVIIAVSLDQWIRKVKA